MRYTSLVQMLLRGSNSGKDITFINNENTEKCISYKELLDGALKVLGFYQRNKLKPEDKVIIYLNDNLSFLYSFWGCILGGITAVPITVGKDQTIKTKLERVIGTLGECKLITSQLMQKDLEDIKTMDSSNVLVFEDIDFQKEDGIIPDIKPQHTAFIQFSSGSTSEPKGVTLTHENLLTNLDAICSGCHIQAHEKTISWMPLTHDMGIIGFHLAPMYAEIDQVLMPAMLFIRNPLLYLEKLVEHKATILCSPNFGIKHIMNFLSLHKDCQLDLSNVRLLFNGAEPISYDLCIKFIEDMKRFGLKENVIFPVYGMAEASLAVTFPVPGHQIEVVRVDRNAMKAGERVILVDEKHSNSIQFVKLGKPVNDCSVQVCNEEGGALGEEEIGEVYIKGKNVTNGYYNNSKATESFSGEDEWKKTGDIGFFIEGQLVITGRKKDIIFINGQNYYSHDIESLVDELNIPGIKANAVCGIPNSDKEDEVVIFAVTKTKIEKFKPIAALVKKMISIKIEKEIKAVIPLPSIPKTTSGKIQRYILVENYLNGLYDEYLNTGETVQPEIEDAPLSKRHYEIKRLFEESLGISNLPIQSNFFEMGGNSIKAIYLISKINTNYNKSLEIKDVMKDFTVKGVSDLVASNNPVATKQLKNVQEAEYYPVLPSQKRLFILNKIPRSETMFNVTKAFEMNAVVSPAKIQMILEKLTELHEALRSNFVIVDEEIFLKVHKQSAINFQVHDIKRKDIKSFIKEFDTPFDLEKDILFKTALLRSRGKTTIVFCIHHIITDGTSLGILLQNFIDLYNERTVPEPAFALKEYSCWKEMFNTTEAFRQQEEYWLQKFSNNIPLLQLPYDHLRPKALNYSGSSLKGIIDKDLFISIGQLASKNHTTEYAVLFSIFNAVINRFSRQNDFVIGTPIANRGIGNSDNIVGMLINTLPIRINIDNNLKYVDYLNNFSEDIFNDIANQYYYNEELAEQIKLKPEMNRNALFDVVFNMQNMQVPAFKLDGADLLPLENVTTTIKVDLTLDITPQKDHYELNVEFSTELFEEKTIKYFMDKYIKMLRVFTESPGTIMKNAEILDEKEMNEFLYNRNNLTKAVVENITFIDAFEKQVSRTPHNIAIKFGDKNISYLELNERANWMAEYINSKKTTKNKIVAVLMERSIERAVVLLGCLKSGKAYLPMEPGNPVERINYMFSDSQSEILITDSSSPHDIEFVGHVLQINTIEDMEREKENYRFKVNSEDPAYIIYTSGTTGNPKGVVASHLNLWGYICAFQQEFSLKATDIVLQQASYAFDTFIEEMYPALTVGGSVSICTKAEVLDITLLTHKITDEQITVVSASPLLINELNKVVRKNSVHTYISGGDVLKWEYINNIIDYSNVYNTYGPTETTVCAAYHKCSKEDLNNPIPIGKPIANYKIFVFDDAGKLCPAGVVGEICVGGIGVSKGYLGNAPLTEEKFVINPYVGNELVYKTGDLGRWTSKGEIEYMGRRDNQVNIRGYRIETQEIEQQLLKHTAVNDTAVIDLENEQGERVLAAYIITNADIKVSHLKEHLLKFLPEYMVPSYFVPLESLPVTPNGKLERKSLPCPQDNMLMNEDYEEARNDNELKLIEIWKEILCIDKIGINDNFFELGGHSLKLTIMISRIHKELGVELKLSEVFSLQTIKEISEHIGRSTESEFDEIKPIEEKEGYEVSSAQKRMYMLQRFDLQSTGYNISGALSITGEIDIDRVAQVIKELVERHESLRTYFVEDKGNILQKTINATDFETGFINCPDKNIHDTIDRIIQPFDLKSAPLFRVTVIKESEAEHVIVFDMHHIISDGVSVGILIKEFSKLYAGEKLAPLHLQYKDFAAWQNKMLQSQKIKEQGNYWTGLFSGEIPVLNLPTDYVRPAVQSFEGKTVRTKIDDLIYKNLSVIAQETNTTMYMLLLAAMNILLAKYTGQSDIIIGSPIAGRYNADLQDVVGMFVNTLAMRNYPDEVKPFKQFLGEVKQNCLDAYQNQDYQFEELIDRLNLTRDMSRNPLFDVMFTMQNIDNQHLDIQGLQFRRFIHEYSISKFDISFTAEEFKGELIIELEYSTHLFRDSTAHAILKHLNNILANITQHADVALKDIEMLSEEENKYIVDELNQTYTAYPETKTFQQMFTEQVLKTPEKQSVIYGNQYLTYLELHHRSNALARTLRAEGVARNTIVGIMAERSLEMFIGVLAIIKAGGAYLPIDPSYPEERIQYMLADSEAKIILSQKSFVDKIGETCNFIDINDSTNYSDDVSDLADINAGTDLIYIIYTSGTTGKPKGVMIEHRNLVNMAFTWINHYKLDIIEARLLQMASIAFDVFAGDMCRALLTGGSLFICPEDTKLEFKSLYTLIKDKKINIFESTPGLIIPFMEYIHENQLSIDSMKVLIMGSDTCAIDDYKKLVDKFGHKMRVLNSYGVTEATIDSSYYEENLKSVPDLVNTPIGRPLDNTQFYILNHSMKPQPIGVSGELYIGGKGVARGYYKNEQLTLEKFPLNPFRAGERMYKTGDLARWLPDGNVEFFGREDYQVKIRGYRVEIREIENQLLQYAGIKEAVVIDKKDENGLSFLVAYITGVHFLNVSHIKEHLAGKLPNYMVPSFIKQLEEKLPVTPNGKIDRKTLGEYEVSLQSDSEYVAPVTATEIKLEGIWNSILGVKKSGVYDNFFELGGHSLKAIALASRIHKEFNVEILLKDIFKSPTLKGISKCIDLSAENRYDLIIKTAPKEWYETSAAQKRMYMLQQLEPDSLGYNMSAAIKIHGELERGKLEESLRELHVRHEALRTSFAIKEGNIVQKIHDSVKVDFQYREVEDINLNNELERFVRTFDLERAPLMRVQLIKQQNYHILLFDIHHIISDGISVERLINDLGKMYMSQSLQQLDIQYKDYSEWQNEMLRTERLLPQANYWREVFSDKPPVLNMPLDYSRPKVQSYEGLGTEILVPTELTQQIRAMAERHNATVYTLLLSAIYILLSKYSGQEEIIVGGITAGRNKPEVDPVVGVFINTLALRNTIYSHEKYEVFLARVRDNAFAAFENQDYPFEELLNLISVRRDPARSPLFDVMFSMEDDLCFDSLETANITFEPVAAVRTSVNFDLRFIAVNRGDEIAMKIEYGTKLFKAATINRMLVHLIHIIEQITAQPEQIIADINLLTIEEKNILLNDFNNTEAAYPREKTFIELFEEQVCRTPDAAAVITKDSTMTYSELNRRANKLAKVLRAEGVKRNAIVAIILERSESMLVSIFAIIKAGGAYLPIDPDYPENRIAYILENSQACLVLTREKYFNKVNAVTPKLDVDKQSYESNGENLELINTPQDLIYVIYTSGSTGNPKGVMIEHRSLVNRINWMQKAYPLTEADTIIQKTTYTFDVSVWELLWWSVVGAKVCLLEHNQEKDVSAIVEAMCKYQITTAHFVPSMLRIFLDYLEEHQKYDEVLSLNRVFTSGEALQTKQVTDFEAVLFKESGTQLINLYGPTEATIDVSYFNCFEQRLDRTIPIGKPIDNIKLFIVDNNHLMLPVGVPGELCIAGDGVARGYLNNQELTDQKFITHPYVPNSKLYKTGDLARWLEDGNIEYLGRIDHQVKLRGFRIELEEIESLLLKYPGIKEAVVVMKKDSNHYEYLCAYFSADLTITAKLLRNYLLAHLPEYMIPAYFEQLIHMPLTANGKLDRKQLPEPDRRHSASSTYREPSNAVEATISEIWRDLLQLDEVGVEDNFFEIGGHSLKVTQMISLLSKKLSVDVPFREIFNAPTIRELAVYIQQHAKARLEGIPVAGVQPYYKLSSAQKRMYLLQQFDRNSTVYNMPEVILIEGNFNKKRLQSVINSLCTRHESLRTRFNILNGEIVQIVDEDVTVAVEYEQLKDGDHLDRMIDQFIRPFDLSSSELFRVKVVEIKVNQHALIFDMHHIISDGTSKGILVKDFAELLSGQELIPLALQYKDYAEWSNDPRNSGSHASKRAYWMEKLSGEIPLLNMPTDFPRPLVQSFKGNIQTIKLSREEGIEIKRLVNKQECTVYMFFLSIFNILLAKYTGQEDILIGTPASGRTHPDLQQIVGMFVNTLVMRNYPVKEKNFNDFLQEVKEVVIAAYDNQEYPFEVLLDELNIKRDVSRNPLFDVMLTMLEDEKTEMSLNGLSLTAYKESNKTSKFDLNISVAVLKEDITVSIQYCSDLFKEDTIVQMGQHLKNIIAAVIENDALKIKDIDVLDRNERDILLYDYNESEFKPNDSLTVQALFEEQVQLNPEALAVCFEDEAITYTELNNRANQVAFSLRKLGVQPNAVVGLLMEKSINMIVGIMGVIKSGAAYLPLDVHYPTERIEYQLSDSQVQLLITDKCTIPLNTYTGTLHEISCLVNLGETSNDRHIENLNSPDDAVYVIYTSGSTGKPKGVVIEHRNLVSLNYSLNDFIYDQYSQPLNIALLAPYIFDASVKQIFSSLLNGHCLCLIRDDYKTDGRRLIEFYNQHEINISDGTPFILNLLSEAYNVSGSQIGVDTFIIGGDVMLPQTIREFRRAMGDEINVVNIYGPTECCVDATAYKVNDYDMITGGSIPIGKPLANTKIYILDSNMQPVPAGVEGEIYISGYGVGRGYINNEHLSRQKFIPNPFIQDLRMYRTGDSGKWLSHGCIEYTGRIDNQVKIRGYRIELSEVEEALLQYNNIKHVAVLSKEDASSVKMLCAYFVSSELEEPSNLKRFLARTLPDYMLPAQFIQLDKLPVTVNGKLDKRTLLAMKMQSVNILQYEAARNPLDADLQKLWSDALQVEKIGINDNFFDLGGNSLTALKIVAGLRERHKLDIGDLFRAQTIKDLSDTLNLRKPERQAIHSEEEASNLLLSKFGIKSVFGRFHHEDTEGIILFVNKMNDGANKFICQNFDGSISPHYIHQVEGGNVNSYGKGSLLQNDEEICRLLKLESIQTGELNSLVLWKEAEKTFNNFEQTLFAQADVKKYSVLPIQRYTMAYDSKILVEFAIEETIGDNVLQNVVNEVIQTFGLLRSKVAAEGRELYWEEYEFPNHIPALKGASEIDISKFKPSSQKKLINEIRGKLNDQKFNELLHKVIIVKKNRKQSVIMWSLHHSIFDGESGRVLQRTFMQYLNNYKVNSINERIQIKDYHHFITEITRQELGVQAQDLIRTLELEKYKALQNKIQAAILGNLEEDEGDLLNVSLKIPEEYEKSFNENVWNISFELFCVFCAAYLKVDSAPALIYSNGRRQGDTYYSSIGEYIDLTPVVIDTSSSSKQWSLIDEKMKYLSKNKINFSNLALSSDSNNFVKEYFVNENGVFNYQLMFNFLGYKSLHDQDLLSYMYKANISRSENSGDTSHMLNGLTFNVMYSENNIVVMINNVNKKSEDELKRVFTETLLTCLEQFNTNIVK